MKQADLTLFVGGLLGVTAVIMAALGSHLAAPSGTTTVNSSWQAATQMHLAHALALLILSSMMQHQPRSMLFPATLAIAAGVVLFSGGIYLSQMAGWPGATRVTPVGGMLLIGGWVLVMLSSFGQTHSK